MEVMLKIKLHFGMKHPEGQNGSNQQESQYQLGVKLIETSIMRQLVFLEMRHTLIHIHIGKMPVQEI